MTRIEEIKARLAKITPYEWEHVHISDGIDTVTICDLETGQHTRIANCNWQADAAFIAQAPNDVAYLLARIEELEKPLFPKLPTTEDYE